MSFAFALYRSLTSLGGGPIDGILRRRAQAGREDASRLDERRGIASAARPAGRVWWCHAASVGETLSILTLIRRLLDEAPDVHVLLTTGTVSSANLVTRRMQDAAWRGLAGRVIHQYPPVDRLTWVCRFLDHWRPDLALFTESELWPVLLSELRARQVPAALINARMSDASARRWRMVPDMARALLSTFTVVLAQTEAEADKLTALGAADARYLGNLKFATPPPPCDDAELAQLQTLLAGRPVWLIASTHPGEDDIAIQIHRQLLAEHPDVLTVIAPRHPERADTIVDIAVESHLEVARRSAGEQPQLWHDIYLADTIGDLGLLYRLCPVVCVGGSLIDHGGHNPIEPAQLGCAIIFGRYMTNFANVAAEMKAARAARQVPDPDMLLFAVSELLAGAEARAALVARAAEVVERNRPVVDRVIDALGPLLDRAARPCAEAA